MQNWKYIALLAHAMPRANGDNYALNGLGVCSCLCLSLKSSVLQYPVDLDSEQGLIWASMGPQKQIKWFIKLKYSDCILHPFKRIKRAAHGQVLGCCEKHSQPCLWASNCQWLPQQLDTCWLLANPREITINMANCASYNCIHIPQMAPYVASSSRIVVENCFNQYIFGEFAVLHWQRNERNKETPKRPLFGGCRLFYVRKHD